MEFGLKYTLYMLTSAGYLCSYNTNICICMICVFFMCFAVCFYVFYVYMGQVPKIKLMMMMTSLA